MKAAPHKSYFFLTLVKLVGYIIRETTKTPLNSQLDTFLKLQTPKNKKNAGVPWNIKIYKQTGL